MGMLYNKYAILCSPARRRAASQLELPNYVKVRDRTGTRADVWRKFMSHKFLMPFLTAAFLIAPAVLPSGLVSAMAPGLSGAAQAKAINLNSSRSTTTESAIPALERAWAQSAWVAAEAAAPWAQSAWAAAEAGAPNKQRRQAPPRAAPAPA
jgi:hypothetical protein